MSTRPGSELVSIPRQTESVHQTHFLLQQVRSAISSITYSPQLRKQASASLRNQFRVKLRILNLYSNKNEHSCQKSAQSAHPGYTDVGMPWRKKRIWSRLTPTRSTQRTERSYSALGTNRKTYIGQTCPFEWDYHLNTQGFFHGMVHLTWILIHVPSLVILRHIAGIFWS